MPALLIRTSILETRVEILEAAERMEEKLVKSRGMKWTVVKGLMVWISEITEDTFEAVRPRRRIVEGLPDARNRAV